MPLPTISLHDARTRTSNSRVLVEDAGRPGIYTSDPCPHRWPEMEVVVVAGASRTLRSQLDAGTAGSALAVSRAQGTRLELDEMYGLRSA